MKLRVVLLALATLVACSEDGGDEQAFCLILAEPAVDQLFADFDPTDAGTARATVAEATELLDSLAAAAPPEQRALIEPGVELFADLGAALEPIGSDDPAAAAEVFLDPDVQQRLTAFAASAEELAEYERITCQAP